MIKNNWSGISKYHSTVYIFGYYFLDGIRQKTAEAALILCIVVVLAKTCFEKLAPKVRCLVPNLLPVKALVRHSSQTIRRVENKMTRSSFNVYSYSGKTLNFVSLIRSNANGNLNTVSGFAAWCTVSWKRHLATRDELWTTNFNQAFTDHEKTLKVMDFENAFSRPGNIMDIREND